MRRYNIVEGDVTTVGGVVQRHTGNGKGFIWHGRIASHIGDKIDCPVCGSVGVIKAAGSRLSFGNHSLTPALHGDLCICKCNPPPVLKHSQEVMYQEVSDSFEVEYNDIVNAVAFIGSSILKKYNLKFKVKNSLGKPVADSSYMLVNEDGETYFGVTDSQGYTDDIFSDVEKKFSVHVLLDDTEGFEND